MVKESDRKDEEWLYQHINKSYKKNDNISRKRWIKAKMKDDIQRVWQNDKRQLDYVNSLRIGLIEGI